MVVWGRSPQPPEANGGSGAELPGAAATRPALRDACLHFPPFLRH